MTTYPKEATVQNAGSRTTNWGAAPPSSVRRYGQRPTQRVIWDTSGSSSRAPRPPSSTTRRFRMEWRKAR